MPRQTYWKGYLKLSLVTCPVTMMPATTDSERVKFRTLNRKTGNPVESHYVDSGTGKEVGDDDQVKGYQAGEEAIVLMEDDELDSVALESTRTIDIRTFAPADSIGLIWLEKPNYLMPGDPVGVEAFAVIREAMKATDTVGISSLVIGARERAVMLEPRGAGIVVWTLRFGDEVRDADAHFAEISKRKSDSKQMALVRKLIDARTSPWDPAILKDVVQENLKTIIEAAKSKGKAPRRKPKDGSETSGPETSGNVINIMDALRKSMAGDAADRKPGR